MARGDEAAAFAAERPGLAQAVIQAGPRADVRAGGVSAIWGKGSANGSTGAVSFPLDPPQRGHLAT